MIVSWKYVIITDTGLEKDFLFQCIDSIKLELGYQVFLHLMKSKDPNKELEPKFRVVITMNGKDKDRFTMDLNKLFFRNVKKRLH